MDGAWLVPLAMGTGDSRSRGQTVRWSGMQRLGVAAPHLRSRSSIGLLAVLAKRGVGRTGSRTKGERELVAQRYRLDEPIGHGGMGQVWRAVDEILDLDVAVKLLNPGPASNAAERFRLEAKAAGRTSDPHVVAVDDRLFLVMELIDGCSLSDETSEVWRITARASSRLVAQVARGLASAMAMARTP